MLCYGLWQAVASHVKWQTLAELRRQGVDLDAVKKQK